MATVKESIQGMPQPVSAVQGWIDEATRHWFSDVLADGGESDWQSYRASCAMIVSSLLGWFLLSAWLTAGASDKQRADRKWLRRRNTVISCAHALVASLFSAGVVYSSYDRLADLVFTDYWRVSQLASCITLAYFVFDTYDNLANFNLLSKIDIFIHHLIIISLYCISLIWRYYITYGVMALGMEMNSIFLHLRMLYILDKRDPTKLIFKAIMILNYGSFAWARFYWLVKTYQMMSVAPAGTHVLMLAVGHGAAYTIATVNLILLWRLVKGDRALLDVGRVDADDRAHENGLSSGGGICERCNGAKLPANGTGNGSNGTKTTTATARNAHTNGDVTENGSHTNNNGIER